MLVENFDGKMSDFYIILYREMADGAEAIWEDSNIPWIGKAKIKGSTNRVYFFKNAKIRQMARKQIEAISGFSFLDYY